MIDSKQLLTTLTRQVSRLVDDLRERVATVPSVGDPLREEHALAFEAERTGWTFTQWADDRLTQVAVGWVLACVFVRFCEDNGLVPDARLSGIGERGDLAKAAQQDYFRQHPHDSDRDYLHDVFASAAELPGLQAVLGRRSNPLWLTDPSADACTELLGLFRATGDDGQLLLRFDDPGSYTEWDTRFLGDLYQDLSEHAKKTYALLQTPDFVEEFILDRTLEPAIDAFGLAETTIIDPTCGSGHFLLGAFDRLWQRRFDAEPAENERVRCQQALDAVWGVDINPFAASIARFRLLVSALKKCQLTSLVDAPNLRIHVAVGDSLLWGWSGQGQLAGTEAAVNEDRKFLYATEDESALRKTFERQYSAVVGNPPYIVPKDKAANAIYRKRFPSCSGKYSLGVPFTELFFSLAAPKANDRRAGFVGMITANSFMKREMGKKLVEKVLPQLDLTHVIDTSGAYIPGHGTPTVILLGRNQAPVADTVRSVLGIRGEPSTPADPVKGLVWSAINAQIDNPGTQSDYVSVVDTERSRFSAHPWSIGGGGAAELKELIDSGSSKRLAAVIATIGFGGISAADDVLLCPDHRPFSRAGVAKAWVRGLGLGDQVRDWRLADARAALFPYDNAGLMAVESDKGAQSWLWPYRTTMGNRATFSKLTYFDEGRPWWEWHQVALDRLRTPLSITLSFVATHNHFVLDRGGRVFKQSAPVIKLPEDSTEAAHLGLIAILNCSVACFWMKQTVHNKGASTDSEGARVSGTDTWDNSFEFDGTKLQQFPLPAGERPVERGRTLDSLATELAAQQPAAIAAEGTPTRARLDAARAEADRIFALMVSAQEELDWHCLHLYGLTDDSLAAPDGQQAPPLQLGERAFEIVLARQVANGDIDTAWFTRHRSTPITELPAHWPAWYRDLVNRRIAMIESDVNIGLVERPENKRRWARTPWETLETSALAEWLLDKLEDETLWFAGGRAETRSLAQLADRAAAHPDWGAGWMDVARLWSANPDIAPLHAVTQLVDDQHVPAQRAARYKPSGLAKRAEWERVWDLQRAEDRGETVGRIAVPPKYGQGDFVKASYWKQRGKLDVAKERFISIVGAERDASSGDSTMVLAWAGFDDAQQAQAIATLLFQRQSNEGWGGQQLVPILAALDETLPWVHQWHPAIDPSIGQTLGAFYAGQIDQTLATIGATRETLAEWRPAAPTRGRRASR